jgi:hypothetical protein
MVLTTPHDAMANINLNIFFLLFASDGKVLAPPAMFTAMTSAHEYSMQFICNQTPFRSVAFANLPLPDNASRNFN